MNRYTIKVVRLFVAEARAPKPESNRFRSSADIAQWARAYYAAAEDVNREQMLVAILDGKNALIGIHHVSTGSLNTSIVHPREVFKAAIVASAGGIALIHNHPSGDPTPSAEDVEITQRLARAGDLLGIRVLDHVIIGIGTGKHVSFLERGLLPLA
jgi:DNA repair protein RadC